MSIESVMPSNHLILCRPLLLLPSIFPSTRVFSSESALCVMWPKYWSFGISPSNEYSGLISLRVDWFDLRAVQGTLKSLLQHHSSCFRAWLFPYYHIKGFEMSCSGETCVIPLNLAPPKLVGPRNPLFRPTVLHNLHNQWFTDPSLGSAGPHATATLWELSAALTRGCIRTPDGIFLYASCSQKWTWAHRESAPPGPLPQS